MFEQLDETKYIHDLLSRFDMLNCSPVTPPAVPNEYFTGDNCIDRWSRENFPIVCDYQALVGALLYMSNWTRPDISKAVSS